MKERQLLELQKRTDMVSESRRMEKEKKARLPTFGLENEFMVSKDVSENVTLGGFSA